MIYLGSSRGLERTLVPRAEIPYFLVPMAPPNSLRGLLLLILATIRAMFLVARLRPRVTFATGGYVSIPASLASWLRRVPLVLFLPDVVPGQAVRRLTPLARRIAVSTEDALSYLPKNKAVVTGYPVRDWFLRVSPAEARRRFDLPADALVLTVFGGSQGARTLNQAIGALLPDLLAKGHVLHICGEQRLGEARDVAAALSPRQRERYHLFPYLHDAEMADALAAADLAVCRSGASTLGELPAVGTPAVLVPLPAARVHQRENAAYLERHGAALVVEDAELGERLPVVLDELLSNRARLAAMAAACRRLARPDAAARIAAVVAEAAT